MAVWVALAPSAQAVEYHFYHSDLLGSNVLVTQRDGEVVQRMVHRPYGGVQRVVDGGGAPIAPGADNARHHFTGHEFDPESDLHYMVARHYDPAIGRFLSVDPGLAGAFGGPSFDRVGINSVNLNGHAYAGNAPTANVDPNGEFFETLFDLGFFAYSLLNFVTEPGVDTAIDLGLDTAGLAIPFVPAGAGAVRRVSRIPTPGGSAKVVDAAGNPAKLGPGAHIEFPAAEAHLANTSKVAPSKDVRGFSTEDRFVLVGPKGEVVIGEGRNRAVAAGVDNATIPKELGGTGEPGMLRYPLGYDDLSKGFVGKADPNLIVRPSIGEGGYVRLRKDPVSGGFEVLPPGQKP